MEDGVKVKERPGVTLGDIIAPLLRAKGNIQKNLQARDHELACVMGQEFYHEMVNSMTVGDFHVVFGHTFESGFPKTIFNCKLVIAYPGQCIGFMFVKWSVDANSGHRFGG